MSETPFYMTRMGRAFYEATMPALVREVARLNENIERLLAVVERGGSIEKKAEPARSSADGSDGGGR